MTISELIELLGVFKYESGGDPETNIVNAAWDGDVLVLEIDDE